MSNAEFYADIKMKIKACGWSIMYIFDDEKPFA